MADLILPNMARRDLTEEEREELQQLLRGVIPVTASRCRDASAG